MSEWDSFPKLLRLGRMALDFGRVNRITKHPDGVQFESDTDHTVMLGWMACAFAEQFFPYLLRIGLVAQYALIHDMVEIYAGDTATLRALTDKEKKDKKAREKAALKRILEELEGVHWIQARLGEYEEQAMPEARFVRAMDKLMPKITHILNNGATLRDQGMGDMELTARYAHQAEELREMLPWQLAGAFMPFRDWLVGEVFRSSFPAFAKDRSDNGG